MITYGITVVVCIGVGWYGNEAVRRYKTTGIYRWHKARQERRDRQVADVAEAVVVPLTSTSGTGG